MSIGMKKILVFSAIVSFLWITPIAYMFADNVPPYVYDVSRSYVVPSRTTVDKQVTVHWAFKRINRVCPGSIVRYIIDEQTRIKTTYDATAVAPTIDVKDHVLNRTFYLPPDITPGPKIYRAEMYFQCNLLQHIFPLHVVTPDLHFEIVP